jgi:hypothetical protein
LEGKTIPERSESGKRVHLINLLNQSSPSPPIFF